MHPFLTHDPVHLANQRVLVRLDLNVPLHDGRVTDDTRITRSLETLQDLIQCRAKIILIAHLGRPQTKSPETSLQQLIAPLEKILKQPVLFHADCVGPDTEKAVHELAPGQILLLENLRYHKGEEENDPHFCQQLARLADFYVNDAFSCSHRAHASVVGITAYLPAIAGRALEKEVKMLAQILMQPKRPIMAIVGGSKVSSKLALLAHLVKKVDYLVIGGGMANTFMASQGQPIGQSLVEPSLFAAASEILDLAPKQSCQIILPQDVRVTVDLKIGCASREIRCDQILPSEKIADIGHVTVELIKNALEKCHTVVWNGPVGVFEMPPFDHGSRTLGQLISQYTRQNGLISVAGGGDTLACLTPGNVGNDFTYTSTAGGAFLEWLEGKTLPGIAALEASFDDQKSISLGSIV